MYLNCKSVKEARGKREDSGLDEGGRNVYYTFSNYMLLPLGLAHIEGLLFFSSLFFPRLVSAAADDTRQ